MKPHPRATDRQRPRRRHRRARRVRAQVELALTTHQPLSRDRLYLWDGLCRAYDALGFAEAADGDEVFRQLVLARLIEPTSKQDSLRVLDEVGVNPVAYRTLTQGNKF